MEVRIIIESRQLTGEELQHLLQSIRDCERKSFPDKEITIHVEVPELSAAECRDLLAGIKPPYEWGPVIIDLNRG